MAIPPFALLVSAAGKSVRFNRKDRDDNIKKEFLEIDGRSILSRSLAPFIGFPSLRVIVVTTRRGTEKETAYALRDISENVSVPLIIMEGGETRTESVKKALLRLQNLPIPFEYIGIHDGARPFITEELVIRIFAASTATGGACPMLPVVDSIKRLSEDGTLVESVPKKNIYLMQTPTFYRFDLILKAFEGAKGDEEDDMEVFVNSGGRPSFVKGDLNNRKITLPSDLEGATEKIEKYMREREEWIEGEDLIRSFREGEE